MTTKILNLHKRNNSEAQMTNTKNSDSKFLNYQTPQHKKMKLTKINSFQTPIPPKPQRILAKKPFQQTLSLKSSQNIPKLNLSRSHASIPQN